MADANTLTEQIVDLERWRAQGRVSVDHIQAERARINRDALKAIVDVNMSRAKIVQMARLALEKGEAYRITLQNEKKRITLG